MNKTKPLVVLAAMLLSLLQSCWTPRVIDGYETLRFPVPLETCHPLALIGEDGSFTDEKEVDASWRSSVGFETGAAEVTVDRRASYEAGLSARIRQLTVEAGIQGVTDIGATLSNLKHSPTLPDSSLALKAQGIYVKEVIVADVDLTITFDQRASAESQQQATELIKARVAGKVVGGNKIDAEDLVIAFRAMRVQPFDAERPLVEGERLELPLWTDQRNLSSQHELKMPDASGQLRTELILTVGELEGPSWRVPWTPAVPGLQSGELRIYRIQLPEGGVFSYRSNYDGENDVYIVYEIQPQVQTREGGCLAIFTPRRRKCRVSPEPSSRPNSL